MHLEHMSTLERIVQCKDAVADVLGRSPIETARAFEDALWSLRMGHWPVTAPLRASQYPLEADWLPALLAHGGGSCPLWAWVADELLKTPKFLNRVGYRTWTFWSPSLTQALRQGQEFSKQEFDDFRTQEPFWDMYRIIIGKARHFWRALQTKSLPAGRSWLDEALDFGRADAIREPLMVATGKKRRDTRPATSKKTAFLSDMPLFDREDHREEAPDESAAQKERKQNVEAALSTLSPEEGAVIRLLYWEQHTWEDTAAIMGCPVATAKRHGRNALKKLKGLLGPEH